MDDSHQNSGGLMDSVRRVTNSVLGLAHNRLSLLAVELQEEKIRVINHIIWLSVAMALGVAGVLVAIATLAIFLWERAGYAGLIGLSLVTLGLAALALWLLRRHILNGPQPFATSVAEISKDFETLRPRQ
ncbi:MAG: phage holin family protein [Lacunisphaera sp.]